MTAFHIRKASAEDVPEISSLTIQSKAHWKYTQEQMDTFRSELTMTPDMLSTRIVLMAEDETGLIGYYSLMINDEERLELEHMFITPSRLGCGIGARLYKHAIQTARELGFDSLVIQSDPNARGFYVRLGATLMKEIPSSIPGRTIPFFVADVTQTDT